jgi:two-component system, cell cycle response regulator
VRVLIADDEELARMILRAQLTQLGHDVVAVENGRLALDALGAPGAPRLAILDWNMPELDGIDVCRAVRQRADGPYTYLVLLTGRNSPEDLVAGLGAGADDFVVKPVEFPHLQARLRAAERILSLESAILRSRAHLEAVLENIDSGVVLLDHQRRIAFVNGAFERVSQVPRATALGLDRQQFLDRCTGLFDDPQAARRQLTPDEEGADIRRQELEVQRPRRRVIRWTSKRVPLPDGDGRLDICQDVTREAELTRALKEQAVRDPLTGLLNRRGASEAILRELSRARRENRLIAVLLIDIDHFKKVNDSAGHAVGDRVLAAVAALIGGCLRPYDIAARWGGEEFLVVASVDQPANAPVIAERIRASIEAMGAQALPAVTVSIGVDHLGFDEPEASAAIARADAKLYRAKAAGRNCVQ